MKKILFATSNSDKIKEMNRYLSDSDYQLVSLLDLRDEGLLDDIEIVENGKSFEENAHIKANYLYTKLNEVNKGSIVGVLADDSGLVVKALANTMENEDIVSVPGIYSARYVSDHDADKNNDYLLKRMKNVSDRGCYYQSTLCYVDKNTDPVYFTGRLYGTIGTEVTEGNGFAYDSLFTLNNGKNYGKLNDEERLAYSHRIKALTKFIEYLTYLN